MSVLYVRDKDGNRIPIPAIQGPPGPNGAPGAPGATPYIGANGNWYIGTTDTGVKATGIQGIQGPEGPKGEKGDQGIQGPQGPQGPAGAAGKDGTDGVGIASIKQTTTSTADGGNNVFTVTLANGTSASFTVKNGSKGSTGGTGPKGADGKTPVRGTDYWTDADKAEMVSEVIAALPDASEVSY